MLRRDLTLEIVVNPIELFNQQTYEFYTVGPSKPTTLRLKHSLISLSKWEAKWKIPFLTEKKKSKEQTIDYINCMSLTGDIDKKIVDAITMDQFQEITDYIQDVKSATTITNRTQNKGRSEILTSEVFYYYISEFNFPIECEKWHLSRLIKLIEVANVKNSNGGGKVSTRTTMAEYSKLNQMRRAALHTKG